MTVKTEPLLTRGLLLKSHEHPRSLIAEGRRLSLTWKTSYHSHVKVRDVIRQLEDNGWYLARTRGSHRQFKHSSKPGTVTVSGKPGIDIPPGTLNSILKQAGLK